MRFLAIVLCIMLLLPLPCLAQQPSQDNGLETISATSALLMEPSSGRILYEKNAHEARAMASTTKIMTALVAAELTKAEDVLCVQPDCVKIEGSSLYLEEEEELTMLDMLYGLLLRSGNDAAVAIGKHVAGDVNHFVSLMNRKAWELGLSQTNFVNPHGLDHPEHYSTAHDMAILGVAFLKNPLLRDICHTDEYISRELNNGRVRLFINNNKLLVRDPRAIGIKIGWTEEAGRCLVAAARVGDMELLAVVLDAPDLYTDVSKLFDHGFDQVRFKEIVAQGKVMEVVPVDHGNPRRVPLVLAEPIRFPVFPGESVSYSVQTQLPKSVDAPVLSDQPLGKVLVTIDGEYQVEADLVAASNVAYRPGILARLWGWLRGWGSD